MCIRDSERAVSYYAALININAYHQPGVEAGKKAATQFLELLSKIENHLKNNSEEKINSEELSDQVGASPEDCFHALHHLAANRRNINVLIGSNPKEDLFTMNKEGPETG